MNRAAGRLVLFEKDGDYAAFERVLAEAVARFGRSCASGRSNGAPTGWRGSTSRTAAEVEALRRSCRRGSPFGPQAWAERIAQQMGTESSLRPRGRPPKRAPLPAGRIGF